MQRNAICLLIQDENNYYLTPYTDEREENGKIYFSLTDTLTAITIWPHQDEVDVLDDVEKQLCLKFIELKNQEYASNLRSTSSVDFLMNQLDEAEKIFVNAIMQELMKIDNKKWVHEGRNFSTEIIQINLKDVVPPQGFYQIEKKCVDNIALQHSCMEVLKTCVGWPAMRSLSADLTSGEIYNNQKLFHPFALQLNNTVNLSKATADEISADEVKRFISEYQFLQQSVSQQSSATFSRTITDQEIKNLYQPYKEKLEEKLSSYDVSKKIQYD